MIPTALQSAPGLTSVEAHRRLREQGPNTLPTPAGIHPLRKLGLQFVHLFAVMLWVAAALAVLAGMPQLAVAIIVVVVINGIFAFMQEHRADHAAARLRDLVPARARVRRDGGPTTVQATDVVVGDLLLLEAGNACAPTPRSPRPTRWRSTSPC